MAPAIAGFARLSDQQLLAVVTRLAERERQATAALIASLAELDARRLYLGEGCSSLFPTARAYFICPSMRPITASRPRAGSRSSSSSSRRAPYADHCPPARAASDAGESRRPAGGRTAQEQERGRTARRCVASAARCAGSGAEAACTRAGPPGYARLVCAAADQRHQPAGTCCANGRTAISAAGDAADRGPAARAHALQGAVHAGRRRRRAAAPRPGAHAAPHSRRRRCRHRRGGLEGARRAAREDEDGWDHPAARHCPPARSALAQDPGGSAPSGVGSR